MELNNILSRFIERSSSQHMPEAAAELLDLLENDAVEAVVSPGRPIPAEELAERLETKVTKLRRRSDDTPEGLDLIEDAVAHLRAHEDEMVAPWTFEDGEGIRWFVLAQEDEVVACYTSRPFVEADV
ncbi:MAG: hypothetical protein IT384_02470 [Deltaproteobacteria bacterium]|nr:hypothetical protein [Deltaproteobacteria bacterium]